MLEFLMGRMAVGAFFMLGFLFVVRAIMGSLESSFRKPRSVWEFIGRALVFLLGLLAIVLSVYVFWNTPMLHYYGNRSN